MNELFLGIHWTLPTLTIASFKRRSRGFELFSTDTLSVSGVLSEDIAYTLKNWLDGRVPSKTKVSAVVSVPESSVFLSTIEFPKTAASDMDEAVYWEVTSRTAGLPGDIIIGWKEIEKTKTGISVATFVLKHEESSRIVKSLTSSGISLRAIEPSSMAATRSLVPVSGDWLLVDLENTETQFTVIHHQVPVFSSSYGVTLAESKLHDGALEATTRDALVANTKKIISYWEEKNGPIARIVVTGSGTRYSGYAKALMTAVKTPSGLGKWRQDTFAKLEMSEESQAKYPQAVGSGMRACTFDETSGINLLPKDDRMFIEHQIRTTKTTVYLKKIVFAQGVIALATVCVFIAASLAHASMSSRISQTERFVYAHPAQKSISQIAKQNAMISRISSLIALQSDYGVSMGEISRSIPTTLTLTKYAYSSVPKPRLELDGTGSRIGILAFYRELKALSSSAVVSMPYNNVVKERDIAFHITIIW